MSEIEEEVLRAAAIAPGKSYIASVCCESVLRLLCWHRSRNRPPFPCQPSRLLCFTCRCCENRFLPLASSYHLDRLYFATVTYLPKDCDNNVFFTVDSEFTYEKYECHASHCFAQSTDMLAVASFCAEYGPFNLAVTYRFCMRLKAMLEVTAFFYFSLCQ